MLPLRETILVILFVILPLGSTARAETPPADRGTLIYSVGTIEIPMNFSFSYRRIALNSGEAVRDSGGTIGCGCVGIFRARRSDVDYEGRERGKVYILSLPPGEYEIFDFGFGGTIGTLAIASSSARRFSLRFRIGSGEATYIGNFARAPSMGTPLRARFGAAGYFVISNKSERDIPIARRREPALSEVRIEVPDASATGQPMLFARDPLEPAP